MVTVNVGRWFKRGTKTCFTLYTAKFIPELKKWMNKNICNLQSTVTGYPYTNILYTSHSYCPMSASVAPMTVRDKIPLRGSFTIEYLSLLFNSLPSFNHLQRSMMLAATTVTGFDLFVLTHCTWFWVKERCVWSKRTGYLLPESDRHFPADSQTWVELEISNQKWDKDKITWM